MLFRSLENNDWPAIRSDLKKRPVEGVNENSGETEILAILAKYGIKIATKDPEPSTQHPSPSEALAKEGSTSQRSEDPASAGQQPATSTQQPVTLTLWGSGSPYREFLYVDDMVEACIFLMNNVNFSDLISQSPVAEIKNTQINIGTGQDQTIAELAELIKEVVGFNGKIEWDSSKPDGTPRKLLDVTKIKNFGWTEKISLTEGIEKVYSNYSSYNS